MLEEQEKERWGHGELNSAVKMYSNVEQDSSKASFVNDILSTGSPPGRRGIFAFQNPEVISLVQGGIGAEYTLL